jgi:hypothetical protein
MQDPSTKPMSPEQAALNDITYFTAICARDHGAEATIAALRDVLSRWPEANAPTAPQEALGGNFAVAWDMWPKRGKLRSSKQKSRAAWIKIAKGNDANLLTAVKNYVQSQDATKDGGEYVPALDRWLLQGRWESWVDAAPQRVGFV